MEIYVLKDPSLSNSFVKSRIDVSDSSFLLKQLDQLGDNEKLTGVAKYDLGL